MPRTRNAPKATNPYMPGYEMMFREGKRKMAWTRANRIFATSHNYWLATTSPDSGPHVMPVWGVWLDNHFYFSTGPRSRKARNLARNPRCTVCAENSREAVILRGNAHTIARASKDISNAYMKKYEWKLDPNDKDSPMYMVEPKTVFGFVENGAANPTRWIFR